MFTTLILSGKVFFIYKIKFRMVGWMGKSNWFTAWGPEFRKLVMTSNAFVILLPCQAEAEGSLGMVSHQPACRFSERPCRKGTRWRAIEQTLDGFSRLDMHTGMCFSLSLCVFLYLCPPTHKETLIETSLFPRKQAVNNLIRNLDYTEREHVTVPKAEDEWRHTRFLMESHV